MQIGESINIAIDVIRTHKMRSFLTLLGIIIGVTAIIGMQSLISGFQKNLETEMEQLGANVFYVNKYPAIQMGDNEEYRNRKDITMEEAIAIERYCPSVSQIGPEDGQFGITAKYKDRKTSPTNYLVAAFPVYFLNNGLFVGEGRTITEVDVENNRQVVVIGINVVEELFPYQNPISEDIIFDGQRYQVIGVLEEQGSMFGNNRDAIMIIPLTTFQKYYGKNRSLSIAVQVKSPELMEVAQDEVIGVLRAVRKVPLGEPNDFEIFSSVTLMDTFNNMTRMIRIGAIVIVSFALLVAGIGIMNIMLVSIRERTREIGVRLAIGAKRRDILFQFLVEAILLSNIGGIIGILVGIGIGQFVALISPIPSTIPIGMILIGFVFCSLVGLIFGVYPANKASKMDPIEALRYE